MILLGTPDNLKPTPRVKAAVRNISLLIMRRLGESKPPYTFQRFRFKTSRDCTKPKHTSSCSWEEGCDKVIREHEALRQIPQRNATKIFSLCAKLPGNRPLSARIRHHRISRALLSNCAWSALIASVLPVASSVWTIITTQPPRNLKVQQRPSHPSHAPLRFHHVIQARKISLGIYFWRL